MALRRRVCGVGLVVACVLASCALTALAGPLSPDSVAGLQAWYKVDDGVGTSGTAVTDWADKGPNGYDMSQGNSSYQPTMVLNQAGGHKSVDFDGSNDFVSDGDHEVHSNTDGLTIITVVKPDATSYGVIASKFDYAVSQRQWRLATTSLDVQEVPNAWSTDSVARGDPEPGKFHVISGGWAPGSAAQFYIDSRLRSTAALAVNDMTDTAAELILGADNAGAHGQLNGMVSEVIIYNRALTEAERLGVEQYLQQKYDLQPDLGRFALDINFEGKGVNAHNRPLPLGYVTDSGDAFGNRGGGMVYGWDRNGTGQGRDRNLSASPDERFDTVMHMHNGAYGPATWELAVPQGTYWVRAVLGEPNPTTRTHDISIEGTNFSDPDPEVPSDWDEHWGQVTVTDGRITVSQRASGDQGVISFFQVREAVQPDIAINFQTGSSTAGLPPYYLIDGGAAFGDRGNGLSYGWINPATGNPLTNPNGRNRNSGNSPEERYDTLNHLWNGGSQHYGWEIELPNGLYDVLAVFGEPVGLPNSSTNNVWLEDLRYYDVDPGMGAEWDIFMGLVSVTDGRLTLKDIGEAHGAKICFIELTYIPEPSTMALLGLGLLACARRRRRKA